jgi:hypothetical protein
MALSPEAQEVKRKHNRQFWLKKAADYGIPTEGREDEAIKEARKIYTDDYWERKAHARQAK